METIGKITDIKIEQEEAFEIVVFTKRFKKATSFVEIPKFWDVYYGNGYQKVVPPMLGVCMCEQKDDSGVSFEYGIGSIKEYCKEVPEGFKTLSIPKTLWGKFYTRGAMPDAIQQLWPNVMQWVKNSEYKIASELDFECYSEGDDTDPNYESGIWVALEKRTKD